MDKIYYILIHACYARFVHGFCLKLQDAVSTRFVKSDLSYLHLCKVKDTRPCGLGVKRAS